MLSDRLQIASVPSKRTKKLWMHAHRSDRSVAAAVFANGTYFVDTSRKYYSSSKDLANMQHKIHLQVQGLSSYHLSILRYT
jgi:hypothetical protein